MSCAGGVAAQFSQGPGGVDADHDTSGKRGSRLQRWKDSGNSSAIVKCRSRPSALSKTISVS